MTGFAGATGRAATLLVLLVAIVTGVPAPAAAPADDRSAHDPLATLLLDAGSAPAERVSDDRAEPDERPDESNGDPVIVPLALRAGKPGQADAPLATAPTQPLPRAAASSYRARAPPVA